MQPLTYMTSDLVMLWRKKEWRIYLFSCKSLSLTQSSDGNISYDLSPGVVGKMQQDHVSFRDFQWKAVGSKTPYLVPVYVPDYV